jgi:hypothetical protein
MGTARQLGPTFDEPLYLTRGLEHWRTGSYHGLLRLGTMPLPIDVQTLGLHVWECCRGVPFDAEADIDQLLPWARAGTLVFWWLLLLYGWKTAAWLGGRWAARLAVAFLATEPNLLAHASLATTDIAVSACVPAFIYYVLCGRDAPWWRRVGLPAFWLAAATLAKASGLIFCSISLVVLEISQLIQTGGLNDIQPGRLRESLGALWRSTRPAHRKALQIVAIGLFLTFVYCGSDWRSEPSFVAWAESLPVGFGKSTMVWLADHVRIFSNAGEAIVRQVKHNMHGHGAYLLGQSSQRYFWYYFPVLLTLKLAVPILLLPVLLAVTAPRSLANRLCGLAVVLVAFSLTWHVQIGIRLILPVLTLGLVGLGVAVARAVSMAEAFWKKELLVTAAGAGLVWAAASCAMVWPNGLCYVNELWGGTARGYRLVSDANYDWGQGLPELSRWQLANGVDELDVWYFGTDPAMKHLPMHFIPVHIREVRNFTDIQEIVPGRYLAVSTTLLYGAVPSDESHQAAKILRERKPVDRTTTFLIYDLRDRNVEAYSAR